MKRLVGVTCVATALVLGGTIARAQCGTSVFNADGSYESQICLEFGDVCADGGFLAECYSLVPPTTNVCSVVLELTTLAGLHTGQTTDVYVWADDNGVPGVVLGVAVGYRLEQIGHWPTLTRHVIPIDTCAETDFWVGYRGNWPGEACGWFVGVDQDTPAAPDCPIAILCGDTIVRVEDHFPNDAGRLGIGYETDGECPVVPVRQGTWGQIKAFHR